jgi:hypothetical protein
MKQFADGPRIKSLPTETTAGQQGVSRNYYFPRPGALPDRF